MIVTERKRIFNFDRRISAIIFGVMFTVYLFTAGGYWMSSDERDTLVLATSILHQKPIPGYELGTTRAFANDLYPLCYNGILCSIYTVGHAVTEIPFIIFEESLHPIQSDYHWHSSPPERIFTSLFYGPIVCALSVSVFYFILREFNFATRTSIIVSFIYGFASLEFPYATTGFSALPMILVDLCGFLYFIKFQKKKSKLLLLVSAIFYAASFQIREDAFLFVGITFAFLILQSFYKKIKATSIFIFLIPVLLSVVIFGIINLIRFNSFFETGYGSNSLLSMHSTPLYEGLVGILFSPGYGLIVYCPIIISAVISFRHFYRRERSITLLFLAFFTAYLIFYATFWVWSGHLAWGPRYLLPTIPFLLIPLAFMIENYKEQKFKIFLGILTGLGFIINMIRIPQSLVAIWDCRIGGLSCIADRGEYVPSITLYNPQYTSLVNMMKYILGKKPDLFFFDSIGEAQTISIMFSIILILLFFLFKSVRKQEKIDISNTKQTISLSGSIISYNNDGSKLEQNRTEIQKKKINVGLLWNYRELIWNFSINEIKIKHRNSFLGFWWAVLEPLLLLVVLYFIFTYINVKPIENFVVYLFIGLIFWSFFTRSTNFGVVSIIQKSQVFKKIYLPREIPAISSCVTAGILFLVELGILSLFLIIFHVIPGSTIILLPVIILIEVILAFGISLPLSTINAVRRDIHRLWTVIIQGGFFLMPIFYSYDTIPENIKNVLSFIPMAQIIMMARDVIMYNNWPNVYQITYTIVATIIIFIIGYAIFRKLEDRAIEEL